MADAGGAARSALPWLAVAIAVATLAVYAQVHAFPYLNYDDPLYVLDNPQVRAGLSSDGLAWALQPHAGNWHPLTWLSHMLDAELFGPGPRAPHLVNLLLHVANSLLLLLWLAETTGRAGRSALVAALFAVHPLHVEVVVWISERKELLATFFGLLALLAWGRFARGGSRAAQAAGVAAFALSLASKPSFITLPFALLLVDLWPLARFAPGRIWPLLREKLPLFALVLAAIAATLAAQPWELFAALPLRLRVENAIVSYAVYLAQTFAPVGLSPFYPHPGQVAAGRLLLALVGLGAVTLLALWRVRDRPWLLFGWLWFGGTLVPALGLVQVGYQAHADRYTYVPLIGVFVIVAWGGRELLLRLGGREIWMRATAGALVLACALVAHAQARHWRDDLALFSHALAVTERNVLAHTLVAAALEREGSFAEAIVHYEAALSVSDESRRLGGAPAQRPRLRVHLGQALEREGRFAEAARRYQEHLQDVPDDTHALLQLARIRAAHPDPALRDGASALELARRANRLSGYGNPRVLDVLAAALAETGDFAAAVATAGRAVEIAREAGDARSAQRIASRVSGYQEGRPSRMTVR